MKNVITKIKNFINKTSSKLHDGLEWLLSRFGVVLMIVFVSIFAILLRYFLRDMTSGDTYWFLVPWTRFIRDNGGLLSLKETPISYYYTSVNKNIPYGHSTEGYTITGQFLANYPSFYYFLIAIFSYLPISDLAVIKLLSGIFDFIMALGVLFTIKYLSKNNKVLMVLGYTLALFLPTVFINSAVWGQSDAFFAGMGVWFIYFLLKDKKFIAMIFIGIGLSVKLHMFFILPIVGILFLRRRYNLLYLLIPPVVVFLSFIPSYIFGAPFKMPFDLIFGVAGTYSSPNMNSGSMYAFFQNLNNRGPWRDAVKGFGVPFAFLVLIIFTYIFYEKEVEINDDSLLALGTLFSFLTPFLLPHMHERYFFMGDIFIILYAIKNPKRFWLVLVSQAASIITYANFILGGWLFLAIGATGNLVIAASLNVVIITTLTYDILKIKKKEELPPLEIAENA